MPGGSALGQRKEPPTPPHLAGSGSGLRGTAAWCVGGREGEGEAGGVGPPPRPQSLAPGVAATRVWGPSWDRRAHAHTHVHMTVLTCAHTHTPSFVLTLTLTHAHAHPLPCSRSGSPTLTHAHAGWRPLEESPALSPVPSGAPCVGPWLGDACVPEQPPAWGQGRGPQRPLLSRPPPEGPQPSPSFLSPGGPPPGQAGGVAQPGAATASRSPGSFQTWGHPAATLQGSAAPTWDPLDVQLTPRAGVTVLLTRPGMCRACLPAAAPRCGRRPPPRGSGRSGQRGSPPGSRGTVHGGQPKGEDPLPEGRLCDLSRGPPGPDAPPPRVSRPRRPSGMRERSSCLCAHLPSSPSRGRAVEPRTPRAPNPPSTQPPRAAVCSRPGGPAWLPTRVQGCSSA